MFSTVAENFSKELVLVDMLYQPVDTVLNRKIMRLKISGKIVVVLHFQTQFYCLDIGWNSKAAFKCTLCYCLCFLCKVVEKDEL